MPANSNTSQPQNDRVAIITGAGSGVGRAICVLLAGKGFRLTLAGRRAEPLQETASMCGGAAQTLVIPGDIGDASQAQRLVRETQAKWGRIDVLVNNAAVAPVVPIDQTTTELLQSTFAGNTFGPANLVAACWPIFVKQGGGRIVNVSTVSTRDPFPGLAVYAASKAALESMTRSIMNEGREHNILAFTIVLGAVETAMLRGVVSEEILPRQYALDPAEAAAQIAEVALGRRDAEAGQGILVQRQ